MPDNTKATVSASQMPAVFNLSPYATRWMLHKHFADNMPLDVKENDRMDWGKRLERLIMQGAADELRADILPHDQVEYLRHPSLPIGCTPDGYTLDPQRGLGFVECKNIDWLRWRDTWEPTRAADHVELQLQTQMMVPHPTYGLPKWGCIAALVGGNDLLLYHREPLPAVQEAVVLESTAFLEDVRRKAEPEVFGAPIELPALALAYPKSDPMKVLTEGDFEHKRSIEIAYWIDEYMLLTDRESLTKKDRASVQARLLGVLGDAGVLNVHGRWLDVSKSNVKGGTYERKPYVMTRINARLQNGAADLTKLDPAKEEPDLMPGSVFA